MAELQSQVDALKQERDALRRGLEYLVKSGVRARLPAVLLYHDCDPAGGDYEFAGPSLEAIAIFGKDNLVFEFDRYGGYYSVRLKAWLEGLTKKEE